MSDTWVASGWWLASDGKWYPPADAADHDLVVDEVLAHRAVDAPFVLDLRSSEPVVEVSGTEPAAVLTPPPIPAVVAASSAPAPPASVRVAPTGGRWGGHRRVATPIGSTPTV